MNGARQEWQEIIGISRKSRNSVDKTKGELRQVLEENAEAQAPSHPSEFISFSFKDVPNLAGCYPIEFIFCGQSYKNILNWSNFYFKAFQSLFKVYYREQIISRLDSLNKDYYSNDAVKLSLPQRIADNFYIETNISRDKIVTVIKGLLDIRGIAPEKLIVTCERRVTETSGINLDAESVKHVKKSVFNQSSFLNHISESLLLVIESYYPDGISFDKDDLPLLFQHLLAEINKIDAEKHLQKLRAKLFRRSDGRYFHPNCIADNFSIIRMKADIGKFLDSSFKLDIDKFYKHISENCELGGLRGKNDFADFLKFICSCDVSSEESAGVDEGLADNLAEKQGRQAEDADNLVEQSENQSEEADNQDAEPEVALEAAVLLEVVSEQKSVYETEPDSEKEVALEPEACIEAEPDTDIKVSVEGEALVETELDTETGSDDYVSETPDRWIRFEGVNAADFVKTVPCYCYLDGDDVKGRTWGKVLVNIVEHEIAKNNRALGKLQEAPLVAGSSRPFFLKENIANQSCHKCSNDLWICVNYDLPGIMRIIEAFCRRCGYRKDQLDLYGVKKLDKPEGAQEASSIAISGVAVDSNVNSSAAPLTNAGQDADASADADNAGKALKSQVAAFEEAKEPASISDAESKSLQNMTAHEKALFDYLRENTDLAANSCSKYVGVIRSAERYAKEHGYKHCALFTDNLDQIRATANELYADPGFMNYNREQHNRFTAAINKLLEMINSGAHDEDPVLAETPASLEPFPSEPGEPLQQDIQAAERPANVSEVQSYWIKFTFDNAEDFAYTRPVMCLLDGADVRGKNWRKVLINIVEHEIQKQNPALEILKQTSLIRANHPFLLKEKLEGGQCNQLSNGYWIDLYLGIPSLMRHILALCLHCGYTEEQICMYGVKKTDDLKDAPRSTREADASSFEDEPEAAAPDNLSQHAFSEKNEAVAAIMQSRFPNGFRLESIRDLQRFRIFAHEMELPIPESDELLKKTIKKSGILIDGRIYCMPQDFAQELKSIVDGIFSTGAQVIYYHFLLERNLEWMNAYNIYSEEILKEFVRTFIPGCYYSRQFMLLGSRRNEIEAVTDEIKRVWRDRQTESVEELDELLPYIPPENIRRVITGRNLFVNVSRSSTYLLVDRLNISEVDKQEVLELSEKQYNENGFVRLSDLALESIEEDNYELSPRVIAEAVYKKLLSDKFILKQGLLIKADSEQAAGQDVLAMLKQYLSGKDECTISEASDEEKRLTGKESSDYALQALYDTMVRIDKNTFVADRLVSFNSADIDRILESEFVTDHFLGIEEISTFALFPDCGYSWNDYLLASFCYRYSQKYSLHVRVFNKKNAGIIAERDYDKSYDEMLAMAAARAGIELTPEVVGAYLDSAGFIARAASDKLIDICRQAQKLRE